MEIGFGEFPLGNQLEKNDNNQRSIYNTFLVFIKRIMIKTVLLNIIAYNLILQLP